MSTLMQNQHRFDRPQPALCICNQCNGSKKMMNPEYQPFIDDLSARNGKLSELENGSHELFFKRKGYSFTPAVLVVCDRCQGNGYLRPAP
ncbi:MAG: hypothetical protein OEX07_03290 [Gammaproteobacteria bacterium]|nr:hypothetical protein [Gammaproteobacteria bacterium]